MVDAAKLDREIVIESATGDQDEFGQPVQTWSTFDTVWAGKNKDIRTRNKESYQASQLVAERQDYFEIRYLPGLNESMRLKEGTEVYNIISIEELGRGEAMRIFAKNKDRTQEGN